MPFSSSSELDEFLTELDEDVEGMQSTILYLQQELKESKETIETLEKENKALKNGELLQCKNGIDEELSKASNGVSKSEQQKEPATETVTSTATTTTLAVTTVTTTTSTSTSSPGVISNCSVVLRNSEIKLTSERTLRKDKNNVSNKEPRTLRSSSRNMAVDDVRSKKMRLTNGSSDDLNGGSGVVDGDNEQKDDNVENNNFRKRSYESDSSECSNKERTNNKTNVSIKKTRRSSVLSLDLNDEDSRIEIDEDRTIFGNIGTKLNHVDQSV